MSIQHNARLFQFDKYADQSTTRKWRGSIQMQARISTDGQLGELAGYDICHYFAFGYHKDTKAYFDREKFPPPSVHVKKIPKHHLGYTALKMAIFQSAHNGGTSLMTQITSG
jgi:hypothetical protein